MARGWTISTALTGLALAGCPAGVPVDSGTSLTVHAASPHATGHASESPHASAGPVAPPSVAEVPAASASPAASPTPVPSLVPVPPPPTGQPTAAPGPPAATLAEVAAAAGAPVRAVHQVTLTTSKGAFAIGLFPDQAPTAVAKFLVAVGAKVYEGTTFHRVVPGFVAQGGDPYSKDHPVGDPLIGYGTWGDPVPDAFNNGLKHLPGSVALAHANGANTSSVQFYICYGRLAQLDNLYIVFGQVTSGFDVVQRLTPTYTGSQPNGAQPDKILSAVQDY